MSTFSPRDQEIIARMRLFAGLPANEVEHLTHPQKTINLAKGETLFRLEDEATRFFGVLDGWVTVYRTTASGEQAVLGVFGRGETFAEAAMFLGNRYPANAEAAEDCRLAVFSRATFAKRLAENPDLSMAMLATISRHLHRLTRQVEQLQSRNAEQRLGTFLLDLCHGESEPSTIIFPYNKNLIAGRLGMKPESLSRGLSRLARFGVEVDGNTVSVANKGALLEYCEAAPQRTRQ